MLTAIMGLLSEEMFLLHDSNVHANAVMVMNKSKSFIYLGVDSFSYLVKMSYFPMGHQHQWY